MAFTSGQVGYPQSPIYQAKANQQSGNYGSPIYKQEPGAPIPHYSPAYGHNVVSPAYTATVNAPGSNSAASGSYSKNPVGANNFVSPIYSPSAAIQSPAYTSQVSGKFSILILFFHLKSNQMSFYLYRKCNEGAKLRCLLAGLLACHVRADLKGQSGCRQRWLIPPQSRCR